MRVSDDRYAQDLQRMNLALRLIRLEARTHTIRQWTALSDDRIRKLYKRYCSESPAPALARHRGKSPRQAAYFFRTGDCHFHATQLSSLFLVYGLLRCTTEGVRPAYLTGSLPAGAILCSTYEVYRQLHEPALISFEHAWFLLIALSRRHELCLQKCLGCGGMRLRDVLAQRRARCLTCGEDSDPVPLYPRS